MQKIEKEILAITNNATDVNFSDEKGAYLVGLINERKEILDVMFANAVREVECIEQVNELLRKVTQKMCDCVITTRNKVKTNCRRVSQVRVSRLRVIYALLRMRRMR